MCSQQTMRDRGQFMLPLMGAAGAITDGSDCALVMELRHREIGSVECLPPPPPHSQIAYPRHCLPYMCSGEASSSSRRQSDHHPRPRPTISERRPTTHTTHPHPRGGQNGQQEGSGKNPARTGGQHFQNAEQCCSAPSKQFSDPAAGSGGN